MMSHITSDLKTIEHALQTAWVFDGKGEGQQLTPEQLLIAPHPDRFVWIHLKRDTPNLDLWLTGQLQLPEAISLALLSEDTRPRCEFYQNNCLLNLRGINLNPGAIPEEMISMRCWIQGKRLITLSKYHFVSVNELQQQFNEGIFPKSTAELLVWLITGLTDKLAIYLEQLDEQLDKLENNDDLTAISRLITEVTQLRNQVTKLRRYIAPQVAALSSLTLSQLSWLNHEEGLSFRNVQDEVTRVTEDLEAMRERAIIIKDNLQQQLSEKLNRNTYLLTVVAAIFLPISFLTGLLGINVGGLPGTESTDAFLIVCVITLITVVIELVLLKVLKIF
ncbi:zinc transporter ZntB [Zooshikella ganghwensis]|uniref:zinc transporter ZntB n=1 Tax=Zooshikella ganghwensis TaxID=202772 RepID=UPI000A02A531|nr:zinc transporter ZntB [Zooshikella ganghwensis]